MKNIERFNRDLNQSSKLIKKDKESLNIQVNLLLKSIVSRLPETNRAIIIGAGKMEDFSPTFFVNSFDEVIFTDVDLSSVNETLESLGLTDTQKKKITKIRIEYTGFEKNLFFQEFKERIINYRTYEKIDQVINNRLKGLEQYQFLKDYQGSADLVYVSPIYTQLIYNQILHECAILRENRYPEHLLKHIEEKMLDEMTIIISRFNDNLINTVKDDGTLLVLSDILQVDIGSDFHLRIKNGFKNYDVMEEIYARYAKNYGVGLGDYGLLNLDKKLKTKMSRWLLWPYDDNSLFVVKLKIYIKERTMKEELI